MFGLKTFSVFFRENLLRHVQGQLILLNVVLLIDLIWRDLPPQERKPPFQAAADRIETAGQAPPVDGHHKTETPSLALVFAIKVRNVFVDPVIERLFVRPQGDALDFRFSPGHRGLHDAPPLIFAQQGARVAKDEAIERGMTPGHLV